MKKLINNLDFKLFSRGSERKFAQLLKISCEGSGFFTLENHGISASTLKENRKYFMSFFKDLPLEKRMNYSYPELSGQKGYTSIGVEKAQSANSADYKHFYQFGDLYPNSYIEEIPNLWRHSTDLYRQFNDLYKKMMQAVAISLDLDKNFFDDELGNSIIRNIHYPPHANPLVDDGEVKSGGNVLGMCAWSHTDINALTLLHATEPGLQLWNGIKWIPITCKANKIIVNVGDMLWHLTAGHYKSGVHRVVCQPDVERFSSPFFGHRKDECSVVPLSQFGEFDSSIFPFKTEGEFLSHRLEEIGLKKS